MTEEGWNARWMKRLLASWEADRDEDAARRAAPPAEWDARPVGHEWRRRIANPESFDEPMDPLAQWASEYLVAPERWRTMQALNAVLKLCESPVESTMIVALALRGIELVGRIEINGLRIGGPSSYPATVLIIPQANIGAYRADVLVTVQGGEFLLDDARQCVKDHEGRQVIVDDRISVTAIVECDGHDYHERTKEQAARDKSRDRAVQALGHRLFRFAGSEVYANPIACARQVVDALWRVFEQEALRAFEQYSAGRNNT